MQDIVDVRAKPTSLQINSGIASWAEFADSIFAQIKEFNGPTATVLNISSTEFPTLAARYANCRLDHSKSATDFGYLVSDWRVFVARVLERPFRP